VRTYAGPVPPFPPLYYMYYMYLYPGGRASPSPTPTIIYKIFIYIQVDVRTYAGPVPTESREGEWKITYRKNDASWTLQIYCHDSACVQGEARIQAAVIIYNEEDKVIQLEHVPTYVCSRGNHLALTLNVDSPDNSKVMVVLIKPVPL
jgi:hypothetical protein